MEEEKPKRKYTRRAPTKEAPYGYTKNGKIKVRRNYTQMRTGRYIIPSSTHVRNAKDNYVKYYYTAMVWMMWKTGLKQSYAAFIIHLYDEMVFNGKMMREFCKLYGIAQKSFYFLVDKGWIDVIIDCKNTDKRAYELSFKGKKIVASFYNKIELKEHISVRKEINDLIEITNSKSSSFIFSEFNRVQRDFILEKSGISNEKTKSGKNHAWKQKREE